MNWIKCVRPTRTILLCLLIGNAANAAEPPWRAGAASIVITPEQSMWMAGYASRTEPASGKLTELWAKALVLDDNQGNRGVMLTLDLIGIAHGLAQRVCDALAREYGFDRHQIMICTSHTHSGPVVGHDLDPLHYMAVDKTQKKLIDEYADALIEKVVTVVGIAVSELRPSRLQWGSGYESFAVNRRENPHQEILARRATGTLAGPVDHDVPVLTVRNAEGTLTAVLFGYACHATCLSLQFWCGDYPGYAQIRLEEMHPGTVAMFWAGCGGDQNPLPRRTVELAKEYGEELAEAVDEVIAAALPELPAELNTDYREIEAPLSTLPTREELQSQQQPPDGEVVSYQQRWAKHLLQRIATEGALKPYYSFPVAVWTIGDEIDFVALGGEVVVDYALRLKRERRGRRTWVSAYANDVMAYIPSLRVLKEGGYEGGGSNVYYGLPALWDESIEEIIVAAVHQLAPLH